MKKIIQHVFKYTLFLTLSLLSSQEKTHAQTIAAEVPVTYNVNPNGGFEYSIPIRIPPGIKEMVPGLAITYNSQSGNGLLGKGWSLSGVSAITRGATDIEHFYAIDPVDFSGDIYFLDGQRMFSYYAGATLLYLTEVKNFAKIEPLGTAGNGPSYFVVTYPNGMTYEYGNTANSKMLAQGRSDALMWCVNKITDVHGNYITFDYINNQSTGDYRISKITYGQNDNTGSDIPIYIDFLYTTRQDVNSIWVAGSEVKSDVLLEDIVVSFSNSTQANKYHFTYDVNSTISRLIKIEELRDGNSSLPAIDINWNNASASPSLTSTTVSTTKGVLSSGDFNGDGFTDFIAFDPSGGTTAEIFINDKNGDFNTAVSYNLSVTTGVYSSPSNQRIGNKILFDYNGDGLDDIILINAHSLASTNPFFRFFLLEADGSSSVFKAPQQIFYLESDNKPNNQNFHSLTKFTAGDYDGDGKSELIIVAPYHFANSNYVNDYEFYILSDEYGGHKIFHWGLEHINGLMSLDYNGDGVDEFLLTNNFGGNDKSYLFNLLVDYDLNTLRPQLNQTPTQWPVTLHTPPSSNPYTHQHNYFGDFNGDGKEDMISWETNSPFTWHISYSDGTYPTYSSKNAVSPPLSNHIGLPTLNDSYWAADFNGDGLCDFLRLEYVSTNNSNYDIFYSTGTSFIHYDGTIAFDSRGTSMIQGDFNGDGQSDLLNSRDFNILSVQENNRNLVVNSIEHAGKTISIEYSSIPNYNLYQSTTAPDYKYIARTLPLLVVKELSDNIDLDNKYYYEGMLFHKYGLGFRGFEKFTMENSSGQKVYNTFEIATRLPYLKEEVQFDAYNGNAFGIKTTYDVIDVDGGASGDSRIRIHYSNQIHDNLSAQKTTNTITTGSTSPGTVFYQFGQVESKSTITTDLNGLNNTLSTTSYVYGTNWAANRGMPESETVYNEIDPFGNNGISRTTNYTFFSTGDIASIINDPGTVNEKTTAFQYDPIYGNMTDKDITAFGITGNIGVDFEYSSDGKFLIAEENPLGYRKTYGFGSLSACWGNVLSETSIKGTNFITNYEYDAVNRLIMTEDVIHNTSVITTYDWASSSQHANSLANAQFISYTTNTADNSFNATVTDKYGRAIRTVHTGPGGSDIYIDVEYNANGLVTQSTDPYKSPNPTLQTVTSFIYDPYDREVEQNISCNGATRTIRTVYDNTSGQLSTTRTHLGTGNSRTTISCGGVTLRKIGATESIAYTYHGNGTPADVSVNGMLFSTSVDQFGRIDSEIQPDAGTISYQYDALDRVTKKTLANNKEYEFTYDVLGRVLTKKEVNSPLPPYTYVYYNTPNLPTTGHLYQVTAPNGTWFKYSYNQFGQLQQKEEEIGLPQTYSTRYEYYSDGKLMDYIYGNNDLTIRYYYDINGYLNEAELLNATSLTNHTLWFAWGWDAYGRVTDVYLPDQNSTHASSMNPLYHLGRSQSTFNVPHEYKVDLTGGPTIIESGYDFDDQSGNMTLRSDNMRGLIEEFQYDTEYDRLTDVTNLPPVMASPLSMSYDSKGNIVRKSDISSYNHDFRYANNNNSYALETIPDPASKNFEVPSFTQDVIYEPFNKVKKITEAPHNELEFTYGPTQKRIKAVYSDMSTGSAQTVKTKYYAQNYEQIVEANGDKTELLYVFASNEIISVIKIHTPQGSPAQGELFYTVTDPLASITHLLDDLGTGGLMGNGIIEERSFDAWGRVRDENTWVPYNGPANNFPTDWITDRGFTGQEHIRLNTWNNNIINLNGRLYDPLVGRMFSPDPVITDKSNSQDYNKYSYARNNPLKYNDPSGNSPVLIGAFVAGAVNMAVNIGNINSVGDGFMYFGIGATAGLVGGAVSGAVAGIVGNSTAVGGMISGAAGGAAGGFFGGTMNAWANGTYGYNGFKTGASSALTGGLSGALFGGLIGYEKQIAYKKIISQLNIGEKAPGDMADYLKIADEYLTSDAKLTNDEKLEVLMEEEFGYEEPNDRSVTYISSFHRELLYQGYGMTKDGIYVDPDGYYAYGATMHDHTKVGGVFYPKNWVGISPYIINYGGTSQHYIFTAVAGHEIIHAYHYSVFGADFQQNYSEYAAWKFSYNTFLANGDAINAFKANVRMNSYSVRGMHFLHGKYNHTIPKL